MNVSASTFPRLTSLAGLAVVIAAVAVPTALALPATEGGDVSYRTQVALDLRSPDTRDVTTKSLGGVDPAIATAIAGHQRPNVVGDLRSPDTRDVTSNPIVQDAPVAASPMSDGTNWGLVAVMFAAITTLFVGVGALGMQGHGKRGRSVNPA